MYSTSVLFQRLIFYLSFFIDIAMGNLCVFLLFDTKNVSTSVIGFEMDCKLTPKLPCLLCINRSFYVLFVFFFFVIFSFQLYRFTK